MVKQSEETSLQHSGTTRWEPAARADIDHSKISAYRHPNPAAARCQRNCLPRRACDVSNTPVVAFGLPADSPIHFLCISVSRRDGGSSRVIAVWTSIRQYML